MYYTKQIFDILQGNFIKISLIFSLLFFSACDKKEPLPEITQAPPFSLIDSTGKKFTHEALQGKVWVAGFFFSTCPGICPILTRNTTEVYNAYKDNPNFRIVFTTVDPEKDTPVVLADFAKKYKADTAKWHFLTGPAADIKKVKQDGFLLASEELLDHSDRLVLVDSKGKIRKYYRGTEQKQIRQLISDIKDVLKGN